MQKKLLAGVLCLALPGLIRADLINTASVSFRDASGSAYTGLSNTVTIGVSASTSPPPTITQQPGNQVVFVGQNAVFSVSANGATSLTYQWFKNGTAISGATNATYSTPGTVLSDNGSQYSVVVTEPGNVPVTSNAAVLTVNPLPQPQLNDVPSEIPITANINVDYPYPAGSFKWVFTPAAAISQTLDGNAAAPSLTAASITTSSPRLDLSQHALATGAYTFTFQVYDLNGALAAFASTPVTLVGAGLNAVKVFPNPFRAARGDSTMTFIQLPADSTVKIFTVSARAVKTLAAPSGTAVWDLTNDSGEKVASGIYLYLIADTQGNKRHGEFTVIR